MEDNINKYPFEEGETYWTIEDNTIIKSTWDCESENIHNANKEYFETENEAIQHKKINELYQLLSVMQNCFEKIAFEDNIDYKKEAKEMLDGIAVIK